LVNKTSAGTIELNGEGQDGYRVKIIPISENETTKKNLNVTINALNDKLTIQLIEIRLLNSDEIWNTNLSL